MREIREREMEERKRERERGMRKTSENTFPGKFYGTLLFGDKSTCLVATAVTVAAFVVSVVDIVIIAQDVTLLLML